MKTKLVASSGKRKNEPSCELEMIDPWYRRLHIKLYTSAGMVTYAYNPSPWEADAERSDVQGQSQQQSKFGDSLDCMSPCLK